MKLKDKIAIVTGASSGMGREIALLYAKNGATVYAAARRLERLEELAKEADGFAGKIVPLQADLMSKEESIRVVADVVAKEGRLDILVNNAGIMDDFSPVGEFTDEMLERVFALNTFSPFYSTREAIKTFLAQESGIIVNVSSIGGIGGARAGATYTASKHALNGLTKNTAFMYATHGIRCNAICPGGVDTEIGTGDYMKDMNAFGSGRIFPNTAGNPRSGTSDEIATIALFLACDDSSFVNGQLIAADSGWTAF